MHIQNGLRLSVLPLLLQLLQWTAYVKLFTIWHPEMVVTDNGTSFTSKEFEFFLEANGIRHLTLSPYHPASNGLAERTVQIVKQGLKKVTQGTLTTHLYSQSVV